MNFHQHKTFSVDKYKPTLEHREKIALAMLGKTHTNETKKRISNQLSGEKSYQWKGGLAGYSAKHKRIIKHFGRPSKCEFCGSSAAKQFDWANVSGDYKDDISDWKRLCKKCHNGWDASRRHNYEKSWLQTIKKQGVI